MITFYFMANAVLATCKSLSIYLQFSFFMVISAYIFVKLFTAWTHSQRLFAAKLIAFISLGTKRGFPFT